MSFNKDIESSQIKDLVSHARLPLSTAYMKLYHIYTYSSKLNTFLKKPLTHKNKLMAELLFSLLFQYLLHPAGSKKLHKRACAILGFTSSTDPYNTILWLRSSCRGCGTGWQRSPLCIPHRCRSLPIRYLPRC